MKFPWSKPKPPVFNPSLQQNHGGPTDPDMYALPHGPYGSPAPNPAAAGHPLSPTPPTAPPTHEPDLGYGPGHVQSSLMSSVPQPIVPGQVFHPIPVPPSPMQTAYEGGQRPIDYRQPALAPDAAYTGAAPSVTAFPTKPNIYGGGYPAATNPAGAFTGYPDTKT